MQPPPPHSTPSHARLLSWEYRLEADSPCAHSASCYTFDRAEVVDITFHYHQRILNVLRSIAYLSLSYLVFIGKMHRSTSVLAITLSMNWLCVQRSSTTCSSSHRPQASSSNSLVTSITALSTNTLETMSLSIASGTLWAITAPSAAHGAKPSAMATASSHVIVPGRRMI